MNASATTLMPVFAIPFAIVPLALSAEANRALAHRLTALATPERQDPGVPADALLFRGREDLFEWPEVTDLANEMLGGLCATVQAANLCSEAEFSELAVQIRARLLIVRRDGCVPIESTSMASWRVVYCIAAPAAPAPERADSGMLRLYETRFGSMFTDASNCRLREPFTVGHHVWRPAAGAMAVFPGALPYEIALNRASDDLILVTARARFAHPSQGAPSAW